MTAGLGRLKEQELRPLHNAMITLYKSAGVDLIREQLQAVLPPGTTAVDLSPRGLFVRRDSQATTVIYDLTSPGDVVIPQLLEGAPAEDWPKLPLRQLLFSKVPVTWKECIHCWQTDSTAKSDDLLLTPDITLLPPGIIPEMKKSLHLVDVGGPNGNGAAVELGPKSNGEMEKNG